MQVASDGTLVATADTGQRADGVENRTRQFLMRAANRIFVERPLSQVEVIAHLMGYGIEFSGNEGWAFLNASPLYWHIFRRWPHLRRASGEESDESFDETVLLEETGQRVSLFRHYSMGRGNSRVHCLTTLRVNQQFFKDQVVRWRWRLPLT